jgi:hypothetical protein
MPAIPLSLFFILSLLLPLFVALAITTIFATSWPEAGFPGAIAPGDIERLSE